MKMKKNPMLPLWLIPAAMIQTAGAAVNVSGSLAYTQTFDTLPTAAALSQFDWIDDVTIPGFYLHRSNVPAGGTSLAGTRNVANDRPYVSSGSVAANGTPVFHGFLSLGTYNSTDRALGACPTTSDTTAIWAGGTLSIIGLFTNTGTKSLDITDISYEIENWRANSVNPTSETIDFTYKIGSATALLAELNTATASPTFTQAGYNPVNGGSLTYTSADGFATPAVPGSTERSGSLFPPLRLAPGESIVLRWGNANDANVDAQVGIDNLFVNFVEVGASVNPVISNVVRNDMGTPTVPGDDKVDFTLTVAGLGAVNPAGWKISSPFSLSTVTGTYGTAQQVTGVDINEFTGLAHTLDIIVEDQGNPATTATTTLTAPWGTITPVASNVVRDTKGTDSPFDDTWSYTVTVNGVFTGDGWTSNNSNYFNGAYGSVHTVTDLPIAFNTDSATFVDSGDSSITTTFNVAAPLIIGRKNFGVEEKLFSDNNGVPAAWVVDESAFTQSMNNGGAPAKVYRSEVLDLTGLGIVKFSGSLFVHDTSSGNEAADSFNAQLIIDGTTTVSLITPYDTLVPADNILTGAELTPLVPGPPPSTGAGDYTHNFTAVIPADANSVQLVISGNNDSASEFFTVQNLLFELGEHSIVATPTSVQFDNKGTVDPADDEYRQGVIITSVAAPAGSTGWTSNLTPAAGLYTDAQPVFFGPFLMTAGPQTLTLTDNGVPAVQATIAINPPTPGLTATLSSGLISGRGTADFADDTLALILNVAATVGGPRFVVEARPLVPDATDYPLTATTTAVTVNFPGVQSHDAVIFNVSDASYPNSKVALSLAPTTGLVLSQYIFGKKDLGAGLSNFLTIAGAPPSTDWQDFNNPPAVMMNGGVAPASTLTSEVISLAGINGPVHFSANLHTRDTSAGFEAGDTFLAQLIYDGDTANPVNLITPYDTNADGILSGAELVPVPAVNPTTQNFDYPLNADIPDNVNTVQFVVTALNDSTNEYIYVENVLFSLPVVGGDTDGDGMSDAYEDANGLDKNSAADKDTDLDGDGQSNISESVAGTAANNSSSTLKITAFTKTGASASVTWNSVPGKVYRIDVSADLGTWTDLGTDFPAAAGPATQTTATATLPALPSKGSLRVRVK